MGKLAFYRQVRQDRGVRTAIDLNDRLVFHRFEEGDKERDPALLWWVDLRCEGPGLPKESEAARRWLLDHAERIKEGFDRLAEKLHAGVDVDLYPIEWGEFHGLPKRVKATVACSAIRRITALEIAAILRDIAEHWEDRITGLAPVPATAVGS